MKYFLLCIFLVGCSNTNQNTSEIEQTQISALKEYLRDNAVLADPIIVKNVIGSDLSDYSGFVKFKVFNMKRIQTVKCRGTQESTSWLFSKPKLNIFCES